MDEGRQQSEGDPKPNALEDKMQQKIKDCMARGDYYEAQQLCMSLFKRCKKKDPQKAYSILVEGAGILLLYNEITAGSALGMALCKAYAEDGVYYSEESMGRIIRILGSFPSSSATEDAGDGEYDSRSTLALAAAHFEKVVMGAIRWCMSERQFHEISQLHRRLGWYLFENLGMEASAKALQHLLESNSAAELARFTIEVVHKGMDGEEVYFVAHIVIKYMLFRVRAPHTKGGTRCMALLAKGARAYLQLYEEKAGHALADVPIKRFLVLFLESLDNKSLELAMMLSQKYSVILEQHHSLADNVHKLNAKIKKTFNLYRE